MSDQKQTPITREWLESKGFNCVFPDGYKRMFPEAGESGLTVLFSTNNYPPEFMIDDLDGNMAYLPHGPWTQERLSALWFALTGEEL